MTIWQKRVLKFISKILGVIILLIVIALFLYYNYYFKKDNLIKYIPKKALAYSSFRLNDDIQHVKLISGYLKDFDLSDLNQYVAYNSAFALIPNTDNDTLTFDTLLIFNLKQNPSNLQENLEILTANGFVYELLANKTLEQNILVVSNTQNIIEEVKKISFQESSSLADKINVVINLKQLNHDYFGKIYVDVDELTNYTDKVNDLKFKLIVEALKADNIKELFLGIRQENNKLLIETTDINDFQAKEPIIKEIPNDFVVNFSFSDGQDKFKEIYSLLEQQDPNYWQQIEQHKQYYENILNFDFEHDILNLFDKQAQIVIDKDNNYIIALNLEQNNDFESKISQIEQIIKEYIALNNPEEQKKQLPDYTYITQIVKNSQNLEFNTEKIANISVKSIKEGNFEYAYYINENKLFLANSSQIISNMLEKQNLVDINRFNCNNNANFSQNMIIKGQYLKQFLPQFSDFTYLIINEELKDNLVSVCLE